VQGVGAVKLDRYSAAVLALCGEVSGQDPDAAAP
jgi:hypothetical protein